MDRRSEKYNYFAYKALLDEAFAPNKTKLNYDANELPLLATAVDVILANMAHSLNPLTRRQEEVLSMRYPMIVSSDAPTNEAGKNSFRMIAEVIQRTDEPEKFGVLPTAAKGVVTAGLKKVAKSIQENPNLRRFITYLP